MKRASAQRASLCLSECEFWTSRVSLMFSSRTKTVTPTLELCSRISLLLFLSILLYLRIIISNQIWRSVIIDHLKSIIYATCELQYILHHAQIEFFSFKLRVLFSVLLVFSHALCACELRIFFFSYSTYLFII